MDAVRYYKLRNQGLFVSRLYVNYRPGGEESWKTWKPAGYADICIGGERTQDLKELGIEDGSHVRLIAYIAAGSEQIAMEEYIFYSNAGRTASYMVSGDVVYSSLELLCYG